VLIVDDNAALTENLKDILEGSLEAGPTVITAASAGDATRIARARGFDVALVDVRLPDGSGVDLVRALRSASPLGEVILITGIATVDSAIAALQAGAFALLLKSFRPEELLSSVQQALAKVQLKRDRERLMLRQRALIDTAGVLIVGLDRDDCVALFNPKVAELTTSGSPMMVGKHFLTHWANDEGRERMAQALREVRRGGVSVEVEAGFVDGGRGPSRRIHWHLSAVDDPAGRDGLVYGIGLDVTERRALERRAAEAEALSAMGSLALGLAHEIRNPLNAAVLQLHLLGRAIERLDGDSAIKSSMRNRVTIVGSEIGRLERLLTEFLELARPRGVKLEPVDLPKLVDAVIALEQESLALRRVEIHRVIEPCAQAAGDVEKLKQVLINLVANARDALHEGGSLRVRVFGDDEPCFEVSDDGPGIDASVLENVFDPFFTTKEAGTGLGLAIVRKIVGQHAGSVDIDSTPGKGTRVTVKLQKWTRSPQK
jgi:PAS domain S-box-containing protein